jgi:hypothetical protein
MDSVLRWNTQNELDMVLEHSEGNQNTQNGL